MYDNILYRLSFCTTLFTSGTPPSFLCRSADDTAYDRYRQPLTLPSTMPFMKKRCKNG